MNFLTYGPFEFEDLSPEAIRQTFRDIDTAMKDLQYAIGVYIFAVREGKGFKPLYVGKTDRGFGGRIRKHIDDHRFDGHISKSERLNLFLIARATSPKKLKKVTPKCEKARKV